MLGVTLFLVDFVFIEHHAVRPLLPPDIVNGEAGFTLVCIARVVLGYGPITSGYSWKFCVGPPL